MARNKAPQKGRRIASGFGSYGVGIPFIVLAVLLFLFGREGSGDIEKLTGMIFISFGIGVAWFVFQRVWISTGNSKVYHYQKGCSGANKRKNRMVAIIEGLEPCARCHKLKK